MLGQVPDLGQAEALAERYASLARAPSGPCRDQAVLGRHAGGFADRDQSAGVRPAGQRLAALPAADRPAVGPLRPQPARRRLRLSRPAPGRAAVARGPRRTWPAGRSCCMPASSSWRATCCNGGTRRRDGRDRPRRPQPRLGSSSLAALSGHAATSTQTGDRGILDEPVPFLEGRPIPRRSRGHQLRAAAVARGRLALRALPPGDRLHAEPHRARVACR